MDIDTATIFTSFIYIVSYAFCVWLGWSYYEKLPGWRDLVTLIFLNVFVIVGFTGLVYASGLEEASWPKYVGFITLLPLMAFAGALLGRQGEAIGRIQADTVVAGSGPKTDDIGMEVVKKIIQTTKAPGPFLDAYRSFCHMQYHFFLEKAKEANDQFSHEKFIDTYAVAFTRIMDQLPAGLLSNTGPITVPLIDLIQDPKHLTNQLLYQVPFPPYLSYVRAWTVLMENEDLYDRPTWFQNKEMAPWLKRFGGDRYELISHYLENIGFAELLKMEVAVALPDNRRVEHHYILGGTGQGKTTALENLIAHDIRKNRTVMVIDSQGNLIPNILKLDIPMERIVLVDPKDVLFPVALNLFDVGIEAIDDPQKREQHINTLIELYEFVFGGILDADLTQKQQVPFRYGMRLLLNVPGANIIDLYNLMGKNGLEPYRQYLSKLPQMVRKFFLEDFDTRGYAETKEQIRRRLSGILEDNSFVRMFSASSSKLNLHSELSQPGKIILIDTAKGHLGNERSAVLGKFFIALLTEAAQRRASEGNTNRVYCYVDEAYEYFDDHTAQLLAQARKSNVGLILAHQDLTQLSEGVLGAVKANASIKMVATGSASDARNFAADMNTNDRFIMTRPTYHWATFVRGVTDSAISLRLPLGAFQSFGERTDMDELRAMTRQRYTWKPTDILDTEPEEEAGFQGKFVKEE